MSTDHTPDAKRWSETDDLADLADIIGLDDEAAEDAPVFDGTPWGAILSPDQPTRRMER